jgi:hypothetical protein
MHPDLYFNLTSDGKLVTILIPDLVTILAGISEEKADHIKNDKLQSGATHFTENFRVEKLKVKFCPNKGTECHKNFSALVAAEFAGPYADVLPSSTSIGRVETYSKLSLSILQLPDC